VAPLRGLEILKLRGAAPVPFDVRRRRQEI
jgi:hypothetical protein